MFRRLRVCRLSLYLSAIFNRQIVETQATKMLRSEASSPCSVCRPVLHYRPTSGRRGLRMAFATRRFLKDFSPSVTGLVESLADYGYEPPLVRTVYQWHQRDSI